MNEQHHRTKTKPNSHAIRCQSRIHPPCAVHHFYLETHENKNWSAQREWKWMEKAWKLECCGCIEVIGFDMRKSVCCCCCCCCQELHHFIDVSVSHNFLLIRDRRVFSFSVRFSRWAFPPTSHIFSVHILCVLCGAKQTNTCMVHGNWVNSGWIPFLHVFSPHFNPNCEYGAC